MTNRSNQPLQVIVLSGDADVALAACGFHTQSNVLVVHEFIVARPQKMFSLLRQCRRRSVVVVTKDLRYQRFRTIWKLYAAVAGMWTWTFADEHGKTDKFRWGRLFMVEIPLLVWEMLLSVTVLIGGWFRLLRYRRLCQ